MPISPPPKNSTGYFDESAVVVRVRNTEVTMRSMMMVKPMKRRKPVLPRVFSAISAIDRPFSRMDASRTE